MSSMNQLLLDKLHDHQAVIRLLKNGANPNARSHSGETALMLAAQMKRGSVCTALVCAGASLTALDKQGRNVLHHAVLDYDERHLSTMTSLWNAGRLVEYLLSMQNDLLKVQDDFGDKPFDLALRQKDQKAAAAIFVHHLRIQDDWQNFLTLHGTSIPVENVHLAMQILYTCMELEDKNKFIQSLFSTDEQSIPDTPLSKYAHEHKLGNIPLVHRWKMIMHNQHTADIDNKAKSGTRVKAKL